MSNLELMALQDLGKTSEKLLLREELLDKIENISAGSVLACSIAGYGKTTLLSQLALKTERAAVCVLSDSDNDWNFFLGHLFEAVRKSVPYLGIGEPENESQVLLHICQAAMENRLTFIFDNCQLINDGKVCQALQYIMSVAENGFRVVMGSREIPGFAARFILEDRCELLRRDDLALSASEVGEVVKMYFNEDNPEVANYLYNLTGGWAAGVMFCLRSGVSLLQESAHDKELIDLGLIKKYITYEILSDLPSSVVEFVKRASILDCLSADSCDTVLETNNSRECLNLLIENEIFLHKDPEEPTTYMWISIFQQVMADLLSTKERIVIAEKTVEYYLKRKMYMQSIDFAVKVGQPALICRALSVCGNSLLEQEQFELLGECARVLENSSEELDAFIHGILAQYYYVVGDYAKMDYHFNMADSMFGKENIYSVQRTLYRGLLKYETDHSKYHKLVNNALFYLDEYNLKFPFLLPRELKTLEKTSVLTAQNRRTLTRSL